MSTGTSTHTHTQLSSYGTQEHLNIGGSQNPLAKGPRVLLGRGGREIAKSTQRS